MHIAQSTPWCTVCTPLPFCRLLWSLSIPLFHMQLHYAACGMQHGWYYENLFLKLLDICLILPTMYFAVDDRFCVKLWEFTLRSNDASTTLEVICATTPTNISAINTQRKHYPQNLILAFPRHSTSVNGTPIMHWFSINRCYHSCATKTHSIDGTQASYNIFKHNPFHSGYMCTQPCTAKPQWLCKD